MILQVCKSSLVIMKRRQQQDNIYKIKGSTIVGGATTETPHEPMTGDTLLWHLKLGHMSEKGIQMLHLRGLLPGVKSCDWIFVSTVSWVINARGHSR